jgi:hypothetical protein
MKMITAEELRKYVNYDQESGEFRWLIIRGRASKSYTAGSKHRNGYLSFMIGGRRYSAHRIAWLFVHGEWPPNLIDHINGDKADNRISNLRLATKSQNGANRRKSKNNVSGFKGVTWIKRSQKWQAQLYVNGQMKYLGTFDQVEDASEAYRAGAIKHFGEFANTGT